MTDAFETEALRRMAIMAMVRANPYVPFEPTPRQWLFLLDQHSEVLFGGAAGGAKSFALLMAGLMYVEQPGYHALLLRRSYTQLRKPGALIALADEWLSGTDAQRMDNGERWVFPSGATLSFGYLASDADKYNYQGAAYSLIAFDELTQFPSESSYTYLRSRLRQSHLQASYSYPVRIRAATNPGGVGAAWVKSRFLSGVHPERAFIPSKMNDNPHLDTTSYRLMLAGLDAVERQQLEFGNWDIQVEGNVFATDNLTIVTADQSPADWAHPRIQRVRAWDMAATAKETADYCVGVRVAYDPLTKFYAVEDVVRVQQDPGVLEHTLRRVSQADPRGTVQVIEQEPGSLSKIGARQMRNTSFDGVEVHMVRPTGNKVHRARMAAAAIYNGDVEARPEHWLSAFVGEIRAFPQEGMHDDQVDALSYAFAELIKMRGAGPPINPNNVTPSAGTAQTQARIPRGLPAHGSGRIIR